MRWSQRHASWQSVLFDVVPVVVLLVLGLWDVLDRLSPSFGDGSTLSPLVPVIVSCLALLPRRRHPLLSLTIILAALLLPGVLMPTRVTYWGQFVVWLVAMYSAGRHLPWRRGALALPLSLAGYGIAMVQYPGLGETDTMLVNGVALVGVWLLGRLVTDWAAYRERTIRLELERTWTEERAAADELMRIARELHDVLSHSMTVIVMQAGGARLAAAADPGAAVRALVRIEHLSREALAELRTMLQALGDDPHGEGAGTAPQPRLADVDELCARMRTLGLPVTLHRLGDTVELAPAVQRAAYRVVQEGLTNVLKHAGAVVTDVRLEQRTPDATFVVEVVNAPGRDDRQLPSTGAGLAGLRARVGALGGTLSAGPAPGGGFVLLAALPATGQCTEPGSVRSP